MPVETSSTNSELAILFDHQDFVIIDKPADISFHHQLDQQGLFDRLTKQLLCQLWPVHRLDKLTSGLLIFAKSKAAAARFGILFETQQIDKTYIAISDKKPKKKQGNIIGDMKKSRSGNWMLCRSKENPAQTHFVSRSFRAGYRLFWITPSTGKTHQIRVALKSVGSPILGDKRYSGSDADRGYLHAFQLAFNWKDEFISVTCIPTEGQFFGEEALLCQLRAFQKP